MVPLQCYSRVEGVTGIESARSAWELLERMGKCWVLCRFLRSRATRSVPLDACLNGARMKRSRNVTVAFRVGVAQLS